MVKIKQSIITIIIGLALAASISFAAGTWSNPTANPTGGNTEAPINVGGSAQYKSGALGIGGVLSAYSTSNFTGLATFSGGIKIPTNASDGKVLTSDSSGNASWKTPASASQTPLWEVKYSYCNNSENPNLPADEYNCDITCSNGYVVVSGGASGSSTGDGGVSSGSPLNSNTWRAALQLPSAWENNVLYVSAYAVCIK